MKRITFFTKPDCSLCHGALFVIKRVQKQIPFELETVDISSPGNRKWLEIYGHEIPVVHLDDKEIFRNHVDERRLKELLSRG